MKISSKASLLVSILSLGGSIDNGIADAFPINKTGKRYVKLDFDKFIGDSYEDSSANNKPYGLLRKRDDSSEVLFEIKNQQSFYSVELSIGTPSQNVTVLLDTGSSDLWVVGSNNPYCQEGSSNNSSKEVSIDELVSAISSMDNEKFRKLDNDDFRFIVNDNRNDIIDLIEDDYKMKQKRSELIETISFNLDDLHKRQTLIDLIEDDINYLDSTKREDLLSFIDEKIKDSPSLYSERDIIDVIEQGLDKIDLKLEKRENLLNFVSQEIKNRADLVHYIDELDNTNKDNKLLLEKRKNVVNLVDLGLTRLQLQNKEDLINLIDESLNKRSFFSDLGDDIKGGIDEGFDKAKDKITKGDKTAEKALDDIFKRDLFKALGDAIDEGFDKAKDKITKGDKAAEEALDDIFKRSFFSDLGDDIKGGIDEGFDKAKDKITKGDKTAEKALDDIFKRDFFR
ncbi:uncharacterized protein SCODWIG_03193 [Saccharomycodes ludwigii]|uniref:Peptidase A1 domain-containing protein n=1 Tax=Saccharomycodes ludwigii TaxID=36035 RepID=A0A376B9V1_9ASCO|nr:uncharacterized protein SCODWIG_03193 [Saccharomycodes ludwigii]